ncbi:hypothetical protein ACFODZ_04530 [Marinicella sediminis]|uniref:Uncharacterized protein n=1 Tax=Marinicella sediminis TaxID=1792834 RepID=A0ABV7J6C5_9GAMM|nr:hypothetical protein [Marinicella sediminis]
MSTKSQSFILPFLIISGLLLAGAAAWKFIGDEEPAADKKPAVTQPAVVSKGVPESLKKPQPMPAKNEVVEETPTLFEPAPEPITVEERKARKEISRNNMRYAMRYNTLERAMDALKTAVATGDTDKADSLIGFIEKTYPDATIPSELLDF